MSFKIITTSLTVSAFMIIGLLGLSSPVSAVAGVGTGGGHFALASKTQACKGLTELDPSQDCGSNGSTVTSIIGTVVNILSIAVGVIAVIMIVISGLRYITSAGDSGKVSAAKSNLIYALVGLAIAALAQFLVHFVLFQADTATQACKAGTSRAADGSCK